VQEVIKQLIIEGHSLKEIQNICNISFRRLKTLTKKYGYLSASYSDIITDLKNNITCSAIMKRYVVSQGEITKCLTDNITKEDLEVLLKQHGSFTKIGQALELPVNLPNRLAKKVNYSKIPIDIESIRALYSTGDYNKKDLGNKFGCSSNKIADIIKKENIVNNTLNKIEELYLQGKNNLTICSELGISEDRLAFLFKKHAIKAKKKIKEFIDREEFTDLYINKRFTYNQLAEHYDCSLIVIANIIKEINVKRNLKSYIFNRDELYHLYIEKNCTQQDIANMYKCSQNTIDRALADFNIIKTSCYSHRESNIELKIKEFLLKHNVSFIQQSRKIIPPKELDFFLPDYDIAIEVCGLYWHSTKVNPDKYHIWEKYNTCKNLGIQLITIFEDEIEKKEDIVYNRLSSILKLSPADIYARQCTIQKITSTVGIAFLNKVHIQGAGHNKVYLGAFNDNNLVAVMSFSEPSISKGSAQADWELNRFASLDNIPGVASKLFKFFEKCYEPSSVISYADLRWNTGNLYLQLGFNYVHSSKPNYWYTTNQKDRKHRYAFTKQRLLQLFPEEDASQTEQQITEKHNLYRIYDCGSAVYRWTK
jgi:hypothetical protein